MKLRTFLAKDMREALASVRAEMGPAAIIVASERAKGGGIIVRVAIDETAEKTSATGISAEASADPARSQKHDREGPIQWLQSGPRQSSRRTNCNFERAELLAILRAHRAPDRLVHELAEMAEKSELGDMTLALASALDKRMRTSPLNPAECGALLLCGPPGVGKSATAAKIAAHARFAGRQVRLIASDTVTAGALARLETFACHIGATAVTAEGASSIEKMVADAAIDGTLAIIDTAGFDPRHGKSRTAFAALSRIKGVEAIAVLSAMADAEETTELVQALATLGASRVIVTCLDLARRCGALAAAATQNMALAFLSRSPFVAAGLETLSPISLSRLLLEPTLSISASVR
jgi:flagellar biosynthesis protein FlhF